MVFVFGLGFAYSRPILIHSRSVAWNSFMGVKKKL